MKSLGNSNLIRVLPLKLPPTHTDRFEWIFHSGYSLLFWQQWHGPGFDRKEVSCQPTHQSRLGVTWCFRCSHCANELVVWTNDEQVAVSTVRWSVLERHQEITPQSMLPSIAGESDLKCLRKICRWLPVAPMEAPWKVLLRFTPPLALHPSNAQGQHSLMDIVNIFQYCQCFLWGVMSFVLFLLILLVFWFTCCQSCSIIVSLSYHFLMPRIQDFVGEPGRPSAIQLCGLALTCVCWSFSKESPWRSIQHFFSTGIYRCTTQTHTSKR